MAVLDEAVAPSHRTAKPPEGGRVAALRSEHSIVRALHAATAAKEQAAQTLRKQGEALERARAGIFARRNHGAGTGRRK
jgi:hypothetical protein